MARLGAKEYSASIKKAPECQTLEQDAPRKLQSASASKETVFMPPARISIAKTAWENKTEDFKGEQFMITIDDLKNIRRQRLRVTSLRERIDGLRSRAEFTQRQLGECGSDDSTRDRLAEYVADLDDLERQLTEEMITLEQGIIVADKGLTELPENQELVLRLRYCEGLTWRQVSLKTNYCERYCRKLSNI